MWRNRDPCTLPVGMAHGAAAVENSMAVLQIKVKIKLPYDPAIPLLGIYPRELKVGSRRDTCTPMFISCAIHDS